MVARSEGNVATGRDIWRQKNTSQIYKKQGGLFRNRKPTLLFTSTKMVRSRQWSFTINADTTDIAIEYLMRLEGASEAACGVAQVEVGAEGAHPHVQGAIYYKNAISFESCRDKLREATGGYHVAHIEASKGSWDENVTYCTKVATRYVEPDVHTLVRWGQASEPKQGKRTDIDDVVVTLKKALIEDHMTVSEAIKAVATTHGTAFIRMHQGIRALAEQIAPDVTVDPPANWKPWQGDLLWHLTKPVSDDRTIYWVWGTEGNEGKTTVAKFLASFHKGCLLRGEVADMMHAWKEDNRVGIFAIPRTHGKLKAVFEMAEQLKDGMFMSSKYESTMKKFKIPHVVFMANEAPPTDAFSKDRLVSVQVFPGTRAAEWSFGTSVVERHPGYEAEPQLTEFDGYGIM